jgi:tetratricopeptide (TPR) repeat protein
MAGKESNPIQQRMDLLVEKWEVVVAQPGVNMVRIHAEDNEKDMVAAFYTYLLGVDTPNRDIPVIFESIYHEDEQYSRSLLKELGDMLDIWNNANADALAVKPQKVNWAVDYKLIKKDNAAALFIENLNRFAAYLALPKGVNLVAALRVSFVNTQAFTHWLGQALEAGMAPQVKIVFDDTVGRPFYNRFADKHAGQVITLHPKLDMDNAMQQVAAMGNPNDITVQYRQAFVRLTQAIEKRKEKEAEQHAAACIDIATSNIPKNNYWVGQILAVYAALANDQVGYRNFKKAIVYATQGVEAAKKTSELRMDEFVCCKFMGQALMLRASLYTADKQWEKSITDFTLAMEYYIQTNDVILAMEAGRMTGYCNRKFGNIDAACAAWVQALQLSRRIPVHMVKYTTFAGVLEELIGVNHEKFMSREAVEEIAMHVYGNEWMKEVLNWKNPHYEQMTDPAKTIVQ